MRLTVIGCSGSMSGRFSAASAYLLQADGEDEDGRLRTYSAVLDFGPGAMGQLLNYLDPADLDAMVLSHLHTDHCADIIGMQVYRRWLPGGPLARIPVYSPGDGQYRTRQLGGDPDEETYEGEFEFKQIGPGDVVGPGRRPSSLGVRVRRRARLGARRPHDGLARRGARPAGGRGEAAFDASSAVDRPRGGSAERRARLRGPRAGRASG